MSINHKQKLRAALMGSAAWAFMAAPVAMMPSSAFAQQDQASDDAAPVDQIVITGSRLRKNSQNSSVVLEVTPKIEFENRGFVNIIQALNENVNFALNTSSSGTQTQNGDSFAFANILGLGTQRTIVMVDGRRFVPTNQNTVFVPGNATGAQVDVSIIPPSLIERVETVIASGGAVYGADAVAGAINVILKDNFVGLESTAQFGITERGDGEEYRISTTYGRDFGGGRGNFSVSGEYFNQASLNSSQRSFRASNRLELTNPLNGDIRNPAAFNPAAAAAALLGGGSPPPAFLASGVDGQFSTIDLNDSRNPTITFGGNLAGGPGSFSGIATPIENGLVPGSRAGMAADPAGFAVFAPSSLPDGVDPADVIASLAPGTVTTGLSSAQLSSLALSLLQRNRPTPAEFFAASPGLDPNLFVGTFGDPDAFPSILNTDPATMALFPRIAVPMKFDVNGNLVPLVVGERDPATTDINTVIGGDGRNLTELGGTAIRASTERYTGFFKGHYELTPNITAFGDVLFSRTVFDTVSNPTANIGFNGSSGNGSIRIFIDENPLVTAQTLATLNDLEAQGMNIRTQDGSRYINVNRNLSDLFGGVNNSSNETNTYRVTAGLGGDLNFLDRNFYWETSFVYGRAATTNTNQQRLDIEFFLALDVVTDASGNAVCRQQTLAAPESIAVRNPGLGGVANNFGLVPTQAQIDACVPLNIMGQGAPSQAAIDNIMTRGIAKNTTEQFFAAAQFGGDIVELPAGTLAFNTQIEYRNESNVFKPGFVVENGLGQNSNTPPADGTTRFIEWGVEVALPVFGGDFTLPGFKNLEFEGAWRLVNRNQSTGTELFVDIIDQVEGVTDTVIGITAKWNPINDLLIRANYSESVRSPSQTELFGSLQFAFANGNGSFPCTATSVNQGPNPAVRAANCAALFANLGIANPQNFAATFQNINIGETAGVVGNPFLANEQGKSHSFGFVYTPSWLDGAFLQADFTAIDIKNQIGLNGPNVTLPACFDSPDFPNVDLNGTNPCDQFIFGEMDANGVFVVPQDGISQITGNPVLVGPSAGLAINGQGPAQIAFSFFSNLNLALTELRQFSFKIGYNFELAELFGNGSSNWGRVRVTGNLVYLDRFDRFSDGTPATLNPQAGDFIARYRGRLDLDYSIGKFGVLAQFFHTSGTVNNLQTPDAQIPEQQNDFFFPAFNRVNVSTRYRINDRFTVRAVVNNVLDNKGVNIGGDNNNPQHLFDSIGRRYTFRIDASF